jgi:hypothetical protein
LKLSAVSFKIAAWMDQDTKTRRDFLAITASDGYGGTIPVQFSYDRIRALGARSKGQVLEAAEIVPIILQRPKAIFEGLRHDEDDDRRTAGWRCYVGIPDRSYTADGQKRPAWEDKVFLVFINSDRVAYNWRWEKCDLDQPNLPQNWSDRFKTRVL